MSILGGILLGAGLGLLAGFVVGFVRRRRDTSDRFED